MGVDGDELKVICCILFFGVDGVACESHDVVLELFPVFRSGGTSVVDRERSGLVNMTSCSSHGCSGGKGDVMRDVLGV